MDTWEVKCPDCNTVLIVDRKTGKVLEVRRPIVEKGESTGDRFEDARAKVRSIHERAEAKFEATRKAEKEKLSKLDALFKERKKEIEEGGEPIEKPESPFGMD